MALLHLLISLLVSLLLCAINLQLVDAAPKRQLQAEDWQPIHYQVYGSVGGHYMDTEKTLELLKQLKEIYAPFSDEETNGRKNKVDQLVEASVLSSEKCNRAYLDHLQALQKYNNPFRHTLVPYIGHAIRLYLDLCEVKLLENFHYQVNNLDPQIKQDLWALVKATNEVQYGGFSVEERGSLGNIWLHFGHLIEGVLEYLDGKLGSPVMMEIRQQSDRATKFESLFQEHVMNVCLAWTKITDPIEAFHENDLQMKYNAEESEWITYGSFCQFIERHQEAIVKKAYRQFKRRTSAYPKLMVETHRQLRKINPFDIWS